MYLYNVDDKLLSFIDPETGEVNVEEYEAYMKDREDRIENLGLWIKNLDSFASQLKQEEANLKARREAIERKRENLATLLQATLDGEKYQSSKLDISYRKSSAVDVPNEQVFIEWARNNKRDDLLNYPAPKPSKTDIKEYLKLHPEDESIPAKVVNKVTMYVK